MSEKHLDDKLTWVGKGIYPIVVAIIVTLVNAYIYSSGPFEPPAAEISYKVENYYREPDGSYLYPICIWNSGSRDISDFSLLYSFQSYVPGEIMDEDFDISKRLANAMPSIGAGDIVKFSNEHKSWQVEYKLLSKGTFFREQFYINDTRIIKITSMTPDVILKQVTTQCDPCSC